MDSSAGASRRRRSAAPVAARRSCRCITDELAPQLVGQDARRITQLWEQMYNGTRGHYALSRGRTFPVLGRRGLNVAAMSGVDMALWDLLGKSLGAPVVDLWGGACRADMPLYASGGWADAAGIGAELNGYVDTWLLGRQDARRRDGRRRRHQHRQGRGGTLRSRAGHRPDGRRPRHVQRRPRPSASRRASNHSA